MLWILRDLFAGCDGGEHFIAQAIDTVTHARIAEETISSDWQRPEDSEPARRLLYLMVRHCKFAQRTPIPGTSDTCFRVIGRDAFWGLQSRPIAETDMERVEREHEREMNRAIHGLPAERPSDKRTPREYVPMEEAGGIAAELGTCVRNVGRYAAIWRTANFWGSRQPPPDAPDAVFPREGAYPYPFWTFLRAVPRRLMATWRAMWGEGKGKGSTKKPPITPPSSSTPPPDAPSAPTPPATGPPDAYDAYDAAELAEGAAQIAAIWTKRP